MQQIGIPDDDPFEGDKPTLPGWEIPITRHFSRPGTTVPYEYDFGDGWEHEVKLRKPLALPESFKRRLLDGGRAFPPEDCGGVWGYERCVKMLSGATDEADDEVQELKEWLCDWTPEGFDLAATKRAFDR